VIRGIWFASMALARLVRGRGYGEQEFLLHPSLQASGDASLLVDPFAQLDRAVIALADPGLRAAATVAAERRAAAMVASERRVAAKAARHAAAVAGGCASALAWRPLTVAERRRQRKEWWARQCAEGRS